MTKLLTVTALLSLPLSVLARPGQGPGRGGPPPEAIEACDGLAEQDTCTVSHRGSEVDGVCMPGPRPDLPLACRPDRAPRDNAAGDTQDDTQRRGKRGPPQESIDACADLDAQASCSFLHHDQERFGTCQPGPRDDLPLACRPDDAPSR